MITVWVFKHHRNFVLYSFHLLTPQLTWKSKQQEKEQKKPESWEFVKPQRLQAHVTLPSLNHACFGILLPTGWDPRLQIHFSFPKIIMLLSTSAYESGILFRTWKCWPPCSHASWCDNLFHAFSSNSPQLFHGGFGCTDELTPVPLPATTWNTSWIHITPLPYP